MGASTVATQTRAGRTRRQHNNTQGHETMTVSTIRPGLLVALATRISGGVHYSRKDIVTGAEVATWETTRVTDDPAEHDRAVKVRSAARARIERVCSRTSFGLLCPSSEEAALGIAIADAQSMAAGFNATAAHTRIDVNALRGRIADNDREAVQAITREIGELIGRMQSAISEGSIADIRDAANRAREAASMLQPIDANVVDAAIAQARKAARELTKRVANGAETIAAVVADVQLDALQSARARFLDLPAEVTDQPVAEALPAEPTPSVSPARAAGLLFDLDGPMAEVG